MDTVDEKGAAGFLGVSRSFLRQSRSSARRPDAIDGPPWLQYGRAIRYDMDDLRTWRDQHRVVPGERTKAMG